MNNSSLSKTLSLDVDSKPGASRKTVTKTALWYPDQLKVSSQLAGIAAMCCAESEILLI